MLTRWERTRAMLKKIIDGVENLSTYKIEGKIECDNCGRIINGANIPKGETIKDFFKKTPCKNCGTLELRRIDEKTKQ